MQPSDTGNRSTIIKLSVAIAVLIAALVIAYVQVGGQDAAGRASDRVYIDIETGKAFNHTIQIGDMEPIKSPSGALSGYGAEACYWGKDADGKWFIKDKPTYVVLKSKLDPSSEEPTLCPDCGRRVVGHNKRPTPAAVDAANASPGNSDDAESDERGG